jgi:hypothetical protein
VVRVEDGKHYEDFRRSNVQPLTLNRTPHNDSDDVTTTETDESGFNISNVPVHA